MVAAVMVCQQVLLLELLIQAEEAVVKEKVAQPLTIKELKVVLEL
jgi:hypothetical protein